MALTDSYGNAVETYKYSAFGLMKVCDTDGNHTVGDTQYGNPYGYTGRRWDSESSLWYWTKGQKETGLLCKKALFLAGAIVPMVLHNGL